MHATMLYLLLFSLQGGMLGAGNPCAPGVQVADDCFGVTYAGCCTNAGTVRWCQDNKLCELSCANQPACGWKSGAEVYDCSAAPKGDPTCQNPYSCFVDGCAPAWEQAGCCDCPCQDCVCNKDPYCCQVAWDPVCVAACEACGGCGSVDGCTPAPTPGCNGCACQECVCELDSFCCTDKWDSLCAASCANECNGGCEICQPDCTGKECGPDGCGGLCGICPTGYECDEGECEKECVPSCAGRECGLDSCGISSCGSCPDGYECNQYQKCVAEPCVPDCGGKQCGNDGCGGTCGDCEEGVACVDGTCVPGACVPQCDGKQCGEDSCGGFCGFCDPGTVCDFALGKCKPYCKPSCIGKECGDDGCGGTCGVCLAGLSCEEALDGTRSCVAPCFPDCAGKQCGPDHCGGTCGECGGDTPACAAAQGYICVAEAACIPDCLGKECGDDGCGGSCGNCPGDWFCQSGMCVPQCTPQCLVPPNYLSYKQCGWDECPGQNVCGFCPEGHYCAEGYVCLEDTCSCDGKACGIPNPGCPSCGDCLEGESCDPVTFQCIPCQPNCQTNDGQIKQCGNDGCGGSCGECTGGFKCDETDLDGDPATFQCEPCVPICLNDLGQVKQCGDDGCGGSCGDCPLGQTCQDENNEGLCVDCVQQCLNPNDGITPMACGPDSCPPGCMDVGISPCVHQSDCAVGQQCNALTGMCVECGSCGTCPPGWICDTTLDDDPDIYICELCNPNCAGKECGDNGCGGICGVCPAGYDCAEGVCVKECNPTAGCFGKECGPNGCPDLCLNPTPVPCGDDGSCKKGLFCNADNNMCEPQECSKYSSCPEGLVCDPNQNLCVACGNCGTCSDDEYCAAGYVCLVKPDDPCENNGWECGDDGQGGSCGECGDGQVCSDHVCVADVEPDAVTPDSTVEPDVVEEDNGSQDCPEGEEWVDGQCVPVAQQCPTGYVWSNGACVEDPGVTTECPEGYHMFFGQCVKDEEEDNGGGGGCSTGPAVPSGPAGLGLLALLLAAAYLASRRRRV